MTCRPTLNVAPASGSSSDLPGVGRLPTHTTMQEGFGVTELAVTLTVMAAVGGLLILVFWVLPWLLDLGGDTDEQVPFREVMDRIESEDKR